MLKIQIKKIEHSIIGDSGLTFARSGFCQRFNAAVMSRKNHLDEQGAYLVELVLVLPFLLALMFMFIWLAIYIQSQISFTSAVNNGVRLAVTRGNAQLMGFSTGQGIIPSLESSDIWSNESEPLFCHRIETLPCKEFYNSWSARNFNGLSFTQLSKDAVYAVAYVNEAVRLSVGDSVRFPCNPNGTPATDGQEEDDGQGCLSCEVVTSSGAALSTATKKRLTISCNFQPIVYPYSTAMNLLGQIIGGSQNPSKKFVINRTMFLDLARYKLE